MSLYRAEMLRKFICGEHSLATYRHTESKSIPGLLVVGDSNDLFDVLKTDRSFGIPRIIQMVQHEMDHHSTARRNRLLAKYGVLFTLREKTPSIDAALTIITIPTDMDEQTARRAMLETIKAPRRLSYTDKIASGDISI